jgi:hypothetical protein
MADHELTDDDQAGNGRTVDGRTDDGEFERREAGTTREAR